MPSAPPSGICGFNRRASSTAPGRSSFKRKTSALVEAQRAQIIVGRHHPQLGRAAFAQVRDHGFEQRRADAAPFSQGRKQQKLGRRRVAKNRDALALAGDQGGHLAHVDRDPAHDQLGAAPKFGEKPFKPRVVGAQPGAPFDRLRMTHNVERYLSESKPTWNNEKKNAVVPIASAAPATTCMIVCALR
ncbi:MAG: hypothetical protein WA668_16525 [Candidatus Cybelea sp.]